jgi:hypothetical protein
VTDRGSGGAPPTAGAAPSAAGAAGAGDEGCISVQTDPNIYWDEPSVMRFSYEYDPETRILALYSLDSSVQTRGLFWRVDASGRLLAYAGRNAGDYLNFREDYWRDEHGNVTQYQFSYENWDDLTEAPSASPETTNGAYTCEHTYDESGLLLSSSSGDFHDGPVTTYVYTHDSRGRCESVETAYKTESWTYSNGRVQQMEEIFVNGGITGDEEERHVTEYRYDEGGRLVAREQDGGGYMRTSADGIPDYVETWTYEQDGSWTHQDMDFSSDTPNDLCEVDGEQRDCEHYIQEFSRGCAALARQIPRYTGLECSYDVSRELPL